MTFNWRETHHGYYGLALIALSFLWGGWWLRVPGLVLAVEDFLWQHALGKPSIIHWAYVKYLWPIPVVQRLNRWLDNLMGNKRRS